MADIVIHDSEAVGGKRKKRSKQPVEEEIVDPSKSNVVYVGRIPHGFYEKEMRDFFEQFGTITKLRISRNKQTGKSKHYGFIKFQLPEVAAIVAESMNNYLLFESMLQVKLVPLERLHPKIWVGANRTFRVLNFQDIQRKQQNKDRTPAEHKRQLQGLAKKDRQRRAKLKAAGIDFSFPDTREMLQEKPKRVKSAGNPKKRKSAEEPKKSKLAEEPKRSKLAEEPKKSNLAEEPKKSKLAKEPKKRKLAEEPKKDILAEEPKKIKLVKKPKKIKLAKE